MWHEFPGFTPTWRITPKFGLNFINLLVYFLPRQFGFRLFSLGSFSIALIFPNGGWNTSLVFTLKFFPLFHNLPCWICNKRSRQKLANNNTKSTVCKRLFILSRHEWHKPHRSQVVPIFMRTPPPVINRWPSLRYYRKSLAFNIFLLRSFPPILQIFDTFLWNVLGKNARLYSDKLSVRQDHR